MNNPETLIHAAEILEREAFNIGFLYRGPKWARSEMKSKHDDMLHTARALRGMAEGEA